MKPETPDNIRLRGLPEHIKNDLNNISKNLGISMTQMLKPLLREKAETYCAKMKAPASIKKKKQNEIIVRGVGNKLKKELENISANTELSITQIMIPKLQLFIEQQPERLRRKYLKE